MFSDISIVTSAVSSFNNMALHAPFFFFVALLMLPLYLLVINYGNDFVNKLGWNKSNIENKIGFWTSSLLLLWIIFFSGTMVVIRDGISLLPIGLAIVIFVLTIIISNYVVHTNLLEVIHKNKFIKILCLLMFLLTCLSGTMTWYGILLQISAVLCGIIVGARIKKMPSIIVFTNVIIGVLTILLLMQPEYFRFGQLGNLTLIHLAGVLLVGYFVVTTMITRYTKAVCKIKQNVFIKLKWLIRLISIFVGLLFILTESVPVFIGLLICIGLLEYISIRHAKQDSQSIYKQCWAIALIGFGILIICPVISAMGIIYLMSLPNKNPVKQLLNLL